MHATSSRQKPSHQDTLSPPSVSIYGPLLLSLIPLVTSTPTFPPLEYDPVSLNVQPPLPLPRLSIPSTRVPSFSRSSPHLCILSTYMSTPPILALFRLPVPSPTSPKPAQRVRIHMFHSPPSPHPSIHRSIHPSISQNVKRTSTLSPPFTIPTTTPSMCTFYILISTFQSPLTVLIALAYL